MLLFSKRDQKKGPLRAMYRHFNYCHQAPLPIANHLSSLFSRLFFFSPYLTTSAWIYCPVTPS